MTRRLTKFGEPVLKKKAAEVEVFDESLKELASDLVDTLYEENGLGLAAPQIDSSKRIFAIDMRRRSDDSVPCEFTIDGKSLPLDIAMPLIAVNPEVEEIGDYVEIAEEGCLSFPGIFAEVERSAEVRLTYQDTDGQNMYSSVRGFSQGAYSMKTTTSTAFALSTGSLRASFLKSSLN